METLGGLVRDRSGDGTALRTGEGREYDYGRLSRTVMKAGNFLRLHGVNPGAVVGIADAPSAEPVVAFLGAALLGAPVRFDPPPGTDAAAVVLPVDRIGDRDPPPGTTPVAFGGPPNDPAVEHFERGVWSENAAFPETGIDGDAVALVTDRGAHTHADLLAAAERIIEAHGIGADDAVAVRAALEDPGAVVAGVVAPLLAGGTVVVAPDGPADGAVADGGAPEERAVDVAAARP